MSKGGRCVGLIILSFTCADCPDIHGAWTSWRPKVCNRTVVLSSQRSTVSYPRLTHAPRLFHLRGNLQATHSFWHKQTPSLTSRSAGSLQNVRKPKPTTDCNLHHTLQIDVEVYSSLQENIKRTHQSAQLHFTDTASGRCYEICCSVLLGNKTDNVMWRNTAALSPRKSDKVSHILSVCL